jgi:uncharacterized protein (DUF983 family)
VRARFRLVRCRRWPAAFLILIVGAIVAVAAILVDLAYSPRWWVHLVWLPVMVGLTLAACASARRR